MSTTIPTNPRWEKFVPVAGQPWRESWHNSQIKFFECPAEHQTAWLNETAKWLFSGRRWPMDPGEQMIEHCVYWWPRVYRIMLTHGWWPTIEESNLFGYATTWSYVGIDVSVLDVEQVAKASPFKVSSGGSSAHYAAVTGAAICRRKAKYYGLWSKEKGQMI